MKKAYSKIVEVLSLFLFLFLIMLGISLLPLPNNYKFYSVMSGSMQPTLKTGSLVIVKPQTNYKVNDIVTFKTKEPGKTLTHRIAEKKIIGQKALYTTIGDANQAMDSNPLLQQNIIGKVLLSLPILGYLISYSKTLPGLIAMIIIPSTIIIYSEIINLKNQIAEYFQKKKVKKYFFRNENI